MKSQTRNRLGKWQRQCVLTGCGALFLCLMAITGRPQTALLVTEYGTGNLRAFDFSGASGVSLPVPPSYSPIAGSSVGADGMVTAPDGRLLINRADGVIHRRS